MAEKKRSSTRKRPARAAADPLEREFGPAPRPEPVPPSGPIPGIACAGDACFLKPIGDLVARFGLKFARGHVFSLTRAAFSGIELMKAFRDFLDEEIALSERATGRGGGGPRVTKIPVE
ncbi:MAG TPA: hypothetical protein VGR00_09800 [Thermoanaerobaculia bacterium]|jgi:hypothetical protein|nr:hypothetical protein [Thermoanaerobaculia bacterium]